MEEIQTFENTYTLAFNVLWFPYFHIGCDPDWNVLYFCVLCCLSSHARDWFAWLDRRNPYRQTSMKWSKTISVCIAVIFDHLWFFANTLFFFISYQIKGQKWKLFLVSVVFYVLYAAYRIALQAPGISSSELTRVQRIPGNILLSFSIGV